MNLEYHSVEHRQHPLIMKNATIAQQPEHAKNNPVNLPEEWLDPNAYVKHLKERDVTVVGRAVDLSVPKGQLSLNLVF